MRVLVIKISSMGDIIHALPALTDAAKNVPGIRFDWVVEEKFAEIPRWHSAVDRVIPVSIRTWRKKIFSRDTHLAVRAFLHDLRQNQYDFIIDAQGLIKSALIAGMAKGLRCGLDKKSAREFLAALFYQQKISVDKNQHAVTRVRELFAKILNYSLPASQADYGIDRSTFLSKSNEQNYCVFLHGTTWQSKHWPDMYWKKLAKIAGENQLNVKLTWGNAEERVRAEEIAKENPHVEILSHLSLFDIAKVLANAKAVIAVDTGFCHLAAALSVPTVSLYGPTHPVLSGAMGESQIHLAAQYPSCAPCLSRQCFWKGELLTLNGEKIQPACLATLTPERVWNELVR